MFFTTARSWAMKIMREAVAGLHVLEQVEDLRLHRHVEGGDRLVADDQLRVEHERAGDADALALAARELVGPAIGGDLGVDARRPRAPRRTFAARSGSVPIFQIASGSATMSRTLRRGFSDEIGSWKIICICGAELAQLLARERGELCPSKRTVPARRAGQLHDRPTGRRLAAARLADEPEGLALQHVEADARDRVHLAGPCRRPGTRRRGPRPAAGCRRASRRWAVPVPAI